MSFQYFVKETIIGMNSIDLLRYENIESKDKCDSSSV